MRFDATGLCTEQGSPLHAAAFMDAVLRGIGQVMLQNNSYAGALFLIGIFCNSTLFGAGALLGTLVSTATALLLGADRSYIRQGLYGFNGALVAIALLYFLEPNLLTFGCVVFAAACSTVLMAALLALFNVWKLPVLTAPFVFVSLIWFLAVARFGRLATTHLLPTAGLPKAVSVEGVVTLTTFIDGVLNGIAQVFFQGSIITGLLFVAGLLVSSRRACFMAVAGSLLGLLVAWGMGAAEPAIRAGAFGFNSVLTAIALGSVFFVWSRATAIHALLGTLAAAVVFAAVSAALEPLGVPALTLPFVLVTWVFVMAGGVFGKLARAG